MTILTAVLSLLLPITFLGLLVGGGVYLFKNKGKIDFDLNTVYAAYLYLMIFISILTLGIGSVFAIKSTFTNFWGIEFSYRQNPVSSEPIYIDGEVKEVEEEYAYEADIEKRDLIRGITMVAISIPFLLLHCYAAKDLAKKKGTVSSIYKIYVTASLILFSIVSIISLPVGVYETLQFFLLEQPESVWDKIVPGEAVATAFTFVPVWVYYFLSFRKLQK